jgi:hypothetical protein
MILFRLYPPTFLPGLLERSKDLLSLSKNQQWFSEKSPLPSRDGVETHIFYKTKVLEAILSKLDSRSNASLQKLSLKCHLSMLT